MGVTKLHVTRLVMQANDDTDWEENIEKCEDICLVKCQCHKIKKLVSKHLVRHLLALYLFCSGTL